MPEEAPPPANVDPPPPDAQPPLGLDNAWERLSGTGRGVVVLLAMALVIGAGVGVGVLAGSGDSGGDQVVLAETASSVVTVGGPPEAGTEVVPVPEVTETDFVPVPVPEETETETDFVPVPVPEATETDLVPVPVPEATETVTEGLPTDPSGVPAVPENATVFTSQAPGPDVGVVTLGQTSVLTWTGGGEQFTLVDRATGNVLVDSAGAGGRIEIEAGEYEFEVTEGGAEWLFAITDA